MRILHHDLEALPLSHLKVVAAKSQGQPLSLTIVGEELFVLIADVIDKILILVSRVSKDLKALSSLNGAVLELSSRLALEVVLLVREEMLPFEEAVAEVCFLMLLTV